MATKVTLGNKAGIFHDQVTGLTICKGEVVEVNPKQASSNKFRSALQSGHIVRAISEQIKAEAEVEMTDEELMESFKDFLNKGTDVKKIAKNFKMEELKRLANTLEITPEDGDTKNDLVEAIASELNEQ